MMMENAVIITLQEASALLLQDDGECCYNYIIGDECIHDYMMKENAAIITLQEESALLLQDDGECSYNYIIGDECII